MNDTAFKPCPFCKENIRITAVKCRFCGEWLEQDYHGHSQDQGQSPLPQQQAKHEADERKKSPQDFIISVAWWHGASLARQEMAAQESFDQESTMVIYVG
jgi:hypothetical protein